MPTSLKNAATRLMIFLAGESGQDLIEYALVVSLIAFGSVVAMQGVATNVSITFSKMGSFLTQVS